MSNRPGTFKKGYDPRRCDYAALNRSRTGIPRSEKEKHSISLGRQDKERRKMYREIMEWLKENIVEPELHENETNSDIVNIWFMILNYGGRGPGTKESTENLRRTIKFISYIQQYLPEQFRNSEMYKSKMRDEEIVMEFENWFFRCKQKLQNYLSKEYFKMGRMKDLEILKRRYKENWSESKVVDLTADANMKVDADTKLEIKISDA